MKRQVFPASVVDYITPIEYDLMPEDKYGTRTQKPRMVPKAGVRAQCIREVDAYCEQRISLVTG